MKKKLNALLTGCILLIMAVSLVGCESKNTSTDVANNDSLLNEKNAETSKEKIPTADTAQSPKTDKSASETAEQDSHVVITDLEPSDGLEFESNGDGTCSIKGIGVCTDKDIVIPTKSPDGNIVTSIAEYAFYNVEDIDSVTLINYDYEIDKFAFQYGEFTTLNIIGGNPVIEKSAFSSCEDLVSISFNDCNIEVGEYAFFSCGKDADISFSNCTGFIDERAFQYGDFINLTINNCELEIDESAFSSCEELTSIAFTNSTITIGEYAFFSCGDSADVEMIDCSVVLDERAFQYCSLNSLMISGSKIEMEDSAFSSCEDLTTVKIDCDTVTLGEYAFFGCEDLTSVSICENAKSDNNIKIDDRAFQYCKRLDSIIIGSGNISVGEYVFSGCSDNLAISISGNTYTANSIQKGLSQ